MRVGYLGPEGTNTHEALLADAGDRELEPVPLATIYDTVAAVRDGIVARALVPIENSLEGSVDATLDALAIETGAVTIVGEVIQPIEHCLITRAPAALAQIETVISHPHATGQCARFLRSRLPGVPVVASSSTAEAVRTVATSDATWAAIGTRLAAQRYGCTVLLTGVEDSAGNETRFVWLARGDGGDAEDRDSAGAKGAGDGEDVRGEDAGRRGHTAGARGDTAGGRWKTAIVFWGAGSEQPGWLVACLGELAAREVNLTRIESRPRRQGLGRYMFFADIEGNAAEPSVAAALAGLRRHVERVRVLGSFPAA